VAMASTRSAATLRLEPRSVESRRNKQWWSGMTGACAPGVAVTVATAVATTKNPLARLVAKPQAGGHINRYGNIAAACQPVVVGAPGLVRRNLTCQPVDVPRATDGLPRPLPSAPQRP